MEILSKNTIGDRLHFCREMCMLYFERNPVAIDGNGLVVEVDEALLVKSKYILEQNIRERLLFRGYSPSTKNDFRVSVISRSQTIIIPIIQRYIR